MARRPGAPRSGGGHARCSPTLRGRQLLFGRSRTHPRPRAGASPGPAFFRRLCPARPNPEGGRMSPSSKDRDKPPATVEHIRDAVARLSKTAVRTQTELGNPEAKPESKQKQKAEP